MQMPKWTWSALFDLVTMITVVLGVVFAAVELRQVRTTQEAAVLLEIYQTLQSPEHVRASTLVHELPDTLSLDELRALMAGPQGDLLNQLGLTFEALGVMVYRGDVSIEWVDELFRFTILESWRKFGPMIRANRAELGYPDLLEWHQWLAERLAERDAANTMPAYEAYRDWTPR